VQRTGDSVDDVAAAAKGSAIGVSGDKLASDANVYNEAAA
jgi:hypothetical protein